MESVRQTLLKRKVTCPGCGRAVSIKFLATSHACDRRRGRPAGSRNAEKGEEEIEAWAARLEAKAVEAFHRRRANENDNRDNENDNVPDNAGTT